MTVLEPHPTATPVKVPTTGRKAKEGKLIGIGILAVLTILILVGITNFIGTRANAVFSSVGSTLAGPADAAGMQDARAFNGDAGSNLARAHYGSGSISQAKGASITDLSGSMVWDYQPAKEDTQPKPAPVRKIIYTADLSIIVKDFEPAEAALRALIAKHEGQIAQSDLGASAGAQRTGRWKIRVPVAKYEAFLKEAAGLGEPERNKLDSQDVTEEFYDVQARIKNKKVEEDRLIQHLKETAGKLTEILEVEKELSRVRGEIEQMQGRLNLLQSLTSLTTVTITLREIKNYVPPQAPTFGTKVSRAFFGSWEALQGFGENLTLFGAALLVWLPLIVAAIGLVAWLLRTKKQPTTTGTQPAT